MLRQRKNSKSTYDDKNNTDKKNNTEILDLKDDTFYEIDLNDNRDKKTHFDIFCFCTLL